MPGIAEGTPRIGTNGNKIYVTHNDRNSLKEGYNVGKISVIRNDRFGFTMQVDLKGAGLFGVMERPAPFGPISAVHEDANGAEKLYFGESWGKGESKFGLLYEFNGTHVIGLRRLSWSTIIQPVLSSDGKSMWIGGTGSSLHAWLANKPFTSQPSWSNTLGSNPKPIMQAPIVASENDSVFVLTHDRQIFCLKATTGEKIWANDGLLAKPDVMHLSGDATILYTVGADEGKVTRFHARTGRVIDMQSCHEIRNLEFCTMPVEGDVSVSQGGDRLSFATIYGDLYILNFGVVDFLLKPTGAPSVAPTTEPTTTVTRNPSLHPSLNPTKNPSYSPRLEPSSIPSIAPTRKPTGKHSRNPNQSPSTNAPSDSTLSPSMSPAASRHGSSSNMTPSPQLVDTPVFTPNAAPAESPVLSPATPVFPPVPLTENPSGPSVESKSSPPNIGVPSLQVEANSAFDQELEIDDLKIEAMLTSLMSDEQGASNSSTGYQSLVIAVVVVLVLVSFFSVGILIAQLRTLRGDRWLELPNTNEEREPGFDWQVRHVD